MKKLYTVYEYVARNGNTTEKKVRSGLDFRQAHRAIADLKRKFPNWFE